MMKQTLTICALAMAMALGAQNTKVQKVYVTSGTKYHLSDTCQFVKKSPNKKCVALTQAQKDGKTLCKRCESRAKKKTTAK